MSNHGTAFVYDLTQFAEVQHEFNKALAAVLPEYDPKLVLQSFANRSGELRRLIASGIVTLINSDGSITVPEQKIVAAQPPTTPVEFPTFLSGRIGIYKTLDAVKTVFTEKGAQIGTYAGQMMSKPEFVLSQVEQDIEWVAVSGRQLGFTRSYTRVALIDRAEKKFMLDRCQPEDGVYIRLGYLKQPKGEWRPLAMDPIADSDGRLFVFYVVHGDDGLYLRSFYGYAGPQWPPVRVWLFRRRKSLSS